MLDRDILRQQITIIKKLKREKKAIKAPLLPGYRIRFLFILKNEDTGEEVIVDAWAFIKDMDLERGHFLKAWTFREISLAGGMIDSARLHKIDEFDEETAIKGDWEIQELTKKAKRKAYDLIQWFLTIPLHQRQVGKGTKRNIKAIREGNYSFNGKKLEFSLKENKKEG